MKNKLSILYYIVSFVMFLAFVFGSYSTVTYFIELSATGSVDLVAEWLNVFIYYINSVGPYLAFSLMTFGIGYMLPAKEKKAKIVVDPLEELFASEEPVEEVTTPEETVEEVTTLEK